MVRAVFKEALYDWFMSGRRTLDSNQGGKDE